MGAKYNTVRIIVVISDQLPGIGLRLPRAGLRVLTGEIVDDIWRGRTRGGAGDGAGDGAGGVLQVGHCLLLSQCSGQLLQRSAG